MPIFPDFLRATPPIRSDNQSLDVTPTGFKEPVPYSLDISTYVALDFDGCLSHESKEESFTLGSASPAGTASKLLQETPVENLFRQNESLRSYFQDYKVEKFTNASLRQCQDLEFLNTIQSKLKIKAWFPLIEKFSELMNWPFMPWSVSDIFTPERSPGDSLSLFLKGSNEKDICPVDQSKLLIVFGQIQHIANERKISKKAGKFIYALVDDRKDILKGLHDFLIKYPFLIPQQVQIHFFYYQGKGVERIHIFQGIGNIYENYHSIMVKMVETLQEGGLSPFFNPFDLVKRISIENEGAEINFSLRPEFRPPVKPVIDLSFFQSSSTDEDEDDEPKPKSLCAPNEQEFKLPQLFFHDKSLSVSESKTSLSESLPEIKK